MSTESFFMDFTRPVTELECGACPLIDVHGISPLPFGQTIPISYDDSSTKMIAVFFGFMCFFLLCALIAFLWWPIKDAKIQGDSDTDVESLPSDWSNDGDYNLKIPRAWIETMRRVPDDQFDARLQQLQKEALENSFESGLSGQHEKWQSTTYLSGAAVEAGAVARGPRSMCSETVSLQFSEELNAPNEEFNSETLIAGEQRTGGAGRGGGEGGGGGGCGGHGVAGAVSGMKSSETMFGRTRKCELCSHGWKNSAAFRRIRLQALEAERGDIKKENFLKIYNAYHQYLLVRYDQSKA